MNKMVVLYDPPTNEIFIQEASLHMGIYWLEFVTNTSIVLGFL